MRTLVQKDSDRAQLSVIMREEILEGISGGYVDDFIRASDNGFRAICNMTRENLYMAAGHSLPCVRTSFSLSRGSDSSFMQDQRHYLCNSGETS